MRVFFLNPLLAEGNTASQVLDEITSMVHGTADLLRIAIAYFTHPEIANALVQRTQKGRATRLLLNTSDLIRPINFNESEIVISRNLIQVLKQKHPLEVQSLGIRAKSGYQNMHHKFIVSAHKVMFGSLNWTTAALVNNFECVALTDEADIIESFIREFDQLWDQSQTVFTPEGKIRIIMCPICRSSQGVDFESWGPFCIDCGHRFKVI